MSDEDEITNQEIASLNASMNDVRGLPSRTQSYTSVASSQGSRQSRLPDYDFGEDDRPGKYQSQKSDKKGKKSGKAESRKPDKKDKKKQKEDKKPPKKDMKAKKVEKVAKKDDKKSKEDPKKKKDETKEKKTKEKDTKNKKSDEKKSKKGKDKDGKSKGKKKSENGENPELRAELESAVAAHASGDRVEEVNGSLSDTGFASQSDAGVTSQSGKGVTSRESSATRGKKKTKKKQKPSKKGKKSESRGRSKSKNNKKGKKDDSVSRRSSDVSRGDVSDVTSRMSDVTTDDERGKKSKKAKKNKKKVKKSKKEKNGPTIITVNEDSEDEQSPKKKRKAFLGIIPVPSKREPLVYSCCMCCSLGAGSLLTGIIYVLFSIAYLVVRVNEMKRRNLNGIWAGQNLLPDVWRLLLVVGMLTASLCLLASLILVVASCLWGQKEHYKRLRRCIMFWIICTVSAVLVNIGEAVYVQAMPMIRFVKFFHSSDSIEEIKSNSTTLWIMTGLHTVFFIYLIMVLISYLRLLKYMDSPKIGTAPPRETPTPTAAPKVVNNSVPTRRKAISNVPNESSIRTVSEVEEVREVRPKPKKRNLHPEMEIPSRAEKHEMRTRDLPKDEDVEDRIYENQEFIESYAESLSSAPISRATSELSLAGPVLPNMKSESFKDVLDDITNDDSIFDNLSTKPKPLKRMPVNRPKVKPSSEGIYMNCNPDLDSDLRPITPKTTSYTKVSKPVKRATSLSDIRGPVYDSPPAEVDFDELLRKKSELNLEKSRSSSKDTGINSLGSFNASAASSDGSHPDISDMERLAEQLKREQEMLDRAGNCDPAVAENLTQMALNALKLSEKILQDVKSTERRQKKEEPKKPDPEELNAELIKQNEKLAYEFFDQLSKDPNAPSANPIEEMFRMYGKDLCSQNPEMVNRYLMSYKALQDGKSRLQQQAPPLGSNISETVMNEQKPWLSILNPSEAVPAASPLQNMQQFPQGPMNPLLSSMSHNSMTSPFPIEDPRRTQSAFSPIHPNSPQMAQPFHTVSHAQNGPPLPNNFFPIEYPMQNSASYKTEPSAFNGPQNSMVPYKPQPQFDPRFAGHQNKWGPKYPLKGMPHDPNMYYDEECPYSCCYGMYDDYGSIYGEYGPYPYNYSDSIYGDNMMYTGPNWYPMGDPSYSIDPYYNPYEFWDEPAPPYTEKSSNSSYRPRASSRGYDSKAGSSSRGYSKAGSSSRGYSRDGASSRGYDSKVGSSSRGYDSKAGSSSRGYSRDGASSRGYDSKAGSSSRGYSRDGTSSRGYDSKAGSSSRGYSKHSQSLPNLLDEDLYSEDQSTFSGQRSRLAQWGIRNEETKDSIGRPRSRGAKSASPKRSSSFSEAKDTNYAYLKGYKAAIREALKTLSSKSDEEFSRKKSRVSSQEEFIEKLISQTGERSRSKSLDQTFSQRDEMIPRTISSDSRMTDTGPRTISRESRSFRENMDNGSRNRSRASGLTSRASGSTSRASVNTEKLSSALTRKTSKLSFRPASRPGQTFFDDPYDDYRATSSVPPSKNEMDDFGMSRKSSQSSVGFRNLASQASDHSDDILSTFELMSSHGGRPSTRSRLSNRKSSRDGKKPIRSSGSFQSSEMIYPYSDGEGNFYNTLDLDAAYPDRHIHKAAASTSRNSGRNSAPLFNDRSRSSNERTERKNDKSVLWFMGDDDKDPIYSSDYGGLGTGESFATSNNRPRSSSFSYRDSKQEDRLESIGSSKRKVTFGSSPHIKQVKEDRIHWN